MARLIVSPLPDRNSVAAFVATEEGKPARGLGLSNFKVLAGVPGSDGARLSISGVRPSTFPGLYVVDLLAFDPTPRRIGLYVFDLLVEDGEDRGQALTSAIMI